jgi:hypothetical protein
MYPGYGGGSNWNGGAFDPETGLMFVPTRNSVMVASLTKADPALTNWNFIRAPTEFIRGPRGLPINRPPWSVINATDMNKGEHVWSRSIGGAPDSIRNHPALKGLKLDFDNMGQPGVRPGPLATKTLLFLAEAGNLSGDPGGPMFRAYDKRTGSVIAEIELPSKASGAPMTYLYEGRQYIVIAVSTQQHPAELVALALPGGTIARSSPSTSRLASSSNSSSASPANGFTSAPKMSINASAADLARRSTDLQPIVCCVSWPEWRRSKWKDLDTRGSFGRRGDPAGGQPGQHQDAADEDASDTAADRASEQIRGSGVESKVRSWKRTLAKESCGD